MRIPKHLGVVLPFLASVTCGPAIANTPTLEQLGDAGPGPGSTVVSTEPTALDLAQEAYATGDFETASSLADEILAAPPDPTIADGARLVQARVAILEERWDDAQGLLAAIHGTESKYVPGYSELAGFLAAAQDGTLDAQSETDRRAVAERLDLLALVPGDVRLAAVKLALQLRLDAALGMREALVRHAALYLPMADPDAVRRWSDEAEAVLADPSALTDAEIEGLFVEVTRDSPLWPSVARRRAETALVAGDLGTASTVLDQAATLRPPAPWIADLRTRISAVADVDPGRIGVLVPTSGPSAAIGERVLAAMEVALQPFGERFVVEARDTAGDEATTRAAVRSLIDESRAVAILGPVEVRVAATAVEEAGASGVPMISLNVQRDVASASDCRFRDFPTYAAEIEALVAYAWDHARGKRFAVLRAAGRYGELLDGLVRDAVERRGGEVVDITPYATDQTEFIDLAQQVRRALPNVIVFADAAARVSLVAPALAYEDLWPQPAPHDPASAAPGGPRREALYLLPSAAVDANALVEAKRYLEGAVAAMGFVPAAAPEQRSAFETEFAARYPSGPTQLDAFAHDAALIVATLVAGGATNRPALCRALASAEPMATAAPFAGFGADGEARRPVRLVVVRDGQTVPLEASP
jgi:ABC-type branched-subunit amino acid transport system substrate-binding protein